MHIPTYKKCNDTDRAVVFIHGFMGSPNQFTDLADAVYNNGCSCMSILLPGHGVGMNGFVKFGVADWERHVQNEIDIIKHEYKEIFLVGHSMGGLLALNASLIKENNIAGVVLISTPLKVNLLNLKSLWQKIRLLTFSNNNEIKSVYIKSNGIGKLKIFTYPSIISPFINFYKLIKKTKKHLSQVFVPVLIFQSKNDETASYKSAKLFYEGLCNTQRTVFSLEKSWHAFYDDSERKFIRDKLIQFIQSENTFTQ